MVASDSYRDVHRGRHSRKYASVYTDRLPAVHWRDTELPVIQRDIQQLKAGTVDGPAPGSVHLDIATGSGRLSAVTELLGAGWIFVGLDRSDDMLDMVSASAGRHRVLADATAAPLPDGVCRLVTCFRFLLNSEPSVRAGMLREALRLLRNDGLLIVNVHGLSGSLTGIKTRVLRRLGLRNEQAVKFATAQAWLDEFELVAVHRCGVLPILDRMPGGRFGRAWCRLDRWLSRCRPLALVSSQAIFVVRPPTRC